MPVSESPRVPAWIADELTTVPDIARFAGVDALEAGLAALAEANPQTVTRMRVGTSRLGDPIHAVRIAAGGSGAERNALVFALPHPNEPVGGLTALHLAARLAADADLRGRIGLTFTIISCIDPDGLRLNENWLGGPFTRTHYARNFYRPAGDQQVEWTFPVDHRSHYFDAMLPETAALARLIDQLRPEFMVSLHNSELGGAYYYLSRPEAELYPVLQAIPPSVGLPLDRGEPESPEIVELSEAIFLGSGIKAVYDWMVESGQDVSGFAGGDGSGGYAERYGTLTMLSEVPYWSHPDSSDPTPTADSYSSRLAAQAADLRSLAELLSGVLADVEPRLTAAASPYLSASRFFVPLMGKVADMTAARVDEPANERPATVAERFSLGDTVLMYRLRYGGMLLRMLDGELAVGNACRVVRDARERLLPAFEQWCSVADIQEEQVTTMPIQSLVATQYGAVLACAHHIGRN